MDDPGVGKLLDLAASLRGAPHPDAVLQITARAAASLTDSAQCAVRLLDASGRRLLVTARSGPPMHATGAARFRADQGFQGWVLKNAKPALTNDPGRDSRFEAREGQKWMPTALGAVPLIGRDGMLGVLGMTRTDGRPYAQRDLEVLGLVAALALPHVENRRLEWVSLTDPLTHLLNRRAFDRRFALATAEARGSRVPLSAILLDLDRFGRVNKEHGLDVGDDVLVIVAERLREACRLEDPIFRWGGEEFLVLLPGATLEEAHTVAERVRSQIKGRPCESRRDPVSMTGSFGVATYTHGDTTDAFFHQMDLALERAKRKGRDRVEVQPPATGTVVG